MRVFNNLFKNYLTCWIFSLLNIVTLQLIFIRDCLYWHIQSIFIHAHTTHHVARSVGRTITSKLLCYYYNRLRTQFHNFINKLLPWSLSIYLFNYIVNHYIEIFLNFLVLSLVVNVIKIKQATIWRCKFLLYPPAKPH